MAPNPVFEFLHKHTLGEVFPLPEGKTVKVLKEGQTVEDAVKLFEAEGIHSAPVVDADGNVLGMLDMLDAVWSIIKVAPTPTAIKEAELRSLEIAGRAMAWEPVEKVIGASGRDPLEPIHENVRPKALFFVLPLVVAISNSPPRPLLPTEPRLNGARNFRVRRPPLACFGRQGHRVHGIPFSGLAPQVRLAAPKGGPDG
jgi:CBS domain